SLAKSVSKEIRLKRNDLVIDIGANDGTLLSNYKRGRLIGFEPSNLCPKEKKSGILWVNDFFDSKLLSKSDIGSASAVTTIAMFYYLEDPVSFAEMIKSVLAPDGIWVCEMNYALDMIDHCSFDHISHEHVTVWSASQFNIVVQKIGLQIFRIERNELNGGSIRFWMGQAGLRPVEKSVRAVFAKEKGRFTSRDWSKFAREVRKASTDLNKIVTKLHKSDKSVMVYGASTRGLTILGASKLNAKLIDAAVERNPEKVGRFYGATGIPVISEDKMRSSTPNALLILPYSFIKEFVKRERAYLKEGGIFVVPLPEPEMITKSSKGATL
ncbi:MAG: methyltransferase domain-containing protein, partial [Bacteroidetes bacterium]